MTGRKWILAAAAAAIVVALGVGAAMAQAGEDANATSFLDRVAAKLGVDRPTLDQAITDARSEELDQRVADGDLTQEQADRLKEHLDELPDDLPFGGPLGRAPHAGGFGFGFEFRHGDQDGFSLKLHGAGFGPFAVHEKLATFLEIDETTLAEELQADGASLGSVAEAHGKTREELRDFLLAELRTGIDAAVDEGWLPQDRADSMYDRIAEHVDTFIDAEFGMSRIPRFFDHGDRSAPDVPQQGDPQQRGETERIFSF